jgi:translation initiation factor IF-1
MRSSAGPLDDCLRTRGVILRKLENGLHEAALPNGKKVICHLSKELASAPPELPDDSVVMLELSPFDLDRARIATVFH